METEIIKTIMKALENFEFSIREYARDGGDSVVKRAVEYVDIFDSHTDEVEVGLNLILKARFLAMVEAEAKRVSVAGAGRKYVLTYSTEGVQISALAFITPKKVCVKIRRGCLSIQKTACLLDYSPLSYTISPSPGSPANEKGIRCAKRLFIQMYHENPVQDVF